MYLIQLNDIENDFILEEVYKCINQYNLRTVTYTSYISDKLPKHNKFDFVILRGSEFLKNTEREDEFIFDGNLILDLSGCNNILQEKITRIFESTKYRVLGQTKFDIENINFNDLCIIKDFLQIKHNNKRFFQEDFLLRIDIYNQGQVYVNETYSGNLLNQPLISLISLFPIQHVNREINEFGCFLYEPYFFLDKNNKIDDIVTYKIELFDKIKNLSNEEFMKLPYEIKLMLTQHYYIKWDDLIPILERKDWVLNEFY